MSLAVTFTALCRQLAAAPLPAPVFDKLAGLLLNQCVLQTNGASFRITELEFYFHTPHHPDPYPHFGRRQHENGTWYFHRYGRSNVIRGGTRKGLDITIGSGQMHPGGILIRGLLNRETGIFINGPSLCAQALATAAGFAAGQQDYTSLVTLAEAGTAFNNNLITLQQAILEPQQVYTAPRFGLNPARPGGQGFYEALYRYYTFPVVKRKGLRTI